MMTSDERRAIAARADEATFDVAFDIGSVRGDVPRGLLHALGVESEEYKRGFDEGFNCADDWYVEKGDDELAAHGLLRAPRDADGAPILPGDLVTHPGTDGAQKVTSVSFSVAGDRVCCLGGFETMGTSSMRHVRDTPELVANDLDELAKYMSLVDNREAHDRLASLAERLREMGGDAR